MESYIRSMPSGPIDRADAAVANPIASTQHQTVACMLPERQLCHYESARATEFHRWAPCARTPYRWVAPSGPGCTRMSTAKRLRSALIVEDGTLPQATE